MVLCQTQPDSCRSWLALLSPSVHRRDPAGCRGVGEGEPRGLFLPVFQWQHQCTICPHRDGSHHRYFRAVRLLRHMPRQPMDAQTGQWRSSNPSNIPFTCGFVWPLVRPVLFLFSTPCFWPWCSWLSSWLECQALSSDMRWISGANKKKSKMCHISLVKSIICLI